MPTVMHALSREIAPKAQKLLDDHSSELRPDEIAYVRNELNHHKKHGRMRAPGRVRDFIKATLARLEAVKAKKEQIEVDNERHQRQLRKEALQKARKK